MLVILREDGNSSPSKPEKCDFEAVKRIQNLRHDAQRAMNKALIDAVRITGSHVAVMTGALVAHSSVAVISAAISNVAFLLARFRAGIRGQVNCNRQAELLEETFQKRFGIEKGSNAWEALIEDARLHQLQSEEQKNHAERHA